VKYYIETNVNDSFYIFEARFAVEVVSWFSQTMFL